MRRRKSSSGQSSSGRLMDSLSTLARAGAGAAASSLRTLVRPPRTSDELWNRLFLALLLIAAVLVLLTFPSSSATWGGDMPHCEGGLLLDHDFSPIRPPKPPHLPLPLRCG